MYVEGVKELSLYVEGVELMASGSSDDCMAVTLLHGSRTERSYAQGFHSVSATRTCVCRATGLDQPTDTIGGCGGGDNHSNSNPLSACGVANYFTTAKTSIDSETKEHLNKAKKRRSIELQAD